MEFGLTLLYQACIISESMSATRPGAPRDLEQVRRTLVSVIEEVQSATDLECPLLEGGTMSLDDVPELDSMVVPAAIELLAERLGITIPDEVNIFEDQDGAARSIDDVALAVCDIQRRETNSKAGVHE